MNRKQLTRPMLAIGVLASSALVSVLVLSVPLALAADPPPGRSSVDDELLKDLDNELLKGAGDLRDTKPSEEKRGMGARSTDPSNEGEDVGRGADGDPLQRISQQMRAIEKLIPEQAKRSTAEQSQQQILSDLSKLIDSMEKQASKQKSSGKNSKQQTAQRQQVQQPKQDGKSGDQKQPGGNNPRGDSSNRTSAPDEKTTDPELQKGLLKDSWGHLPQKDREQMLQNMPEQFLPQYELLIERYFQRLSEDTGNR